MVLALLLAAALQPQALPGFYRTNQIEIGAALELNDDRTFRYQLDYGAVSESAEGIWSSDGKAVYLDARTMTGAYNEPNFDRQPLEIDGEDLLLRRYETVIRFQREDLPTPPAKTLKD